MATRKTTPPAELPKPYLTVTRQDAVEKIDARIRAGNDFLGEPLASPERLDDAERRMRKWRDYNSELLGSLFSNEKLANEYLSKSSLSVYFLGGQTSFSEDVGEFRDDVQRHVGALESIRDRLELFEERPSVPAAYSAHDGSAPVPFLEPVPAPAAGDAVFVVHGRDELAKALVSGTLKDLRLRPIVLSEQPSKGQTIIEKLEYYAGEASFAVILLTPDDVGRSASDTAERSRARQNVVLELGYFIAKLGRAKTCALYKAGIELPDMELPSDFSGVVYTPMDDAGAWKFTLAKELRAAGFTVDLNNL